MQEETQTRCQTLPGPAASLPAQPRGCSGLVKPSHSGSFTHFFTLCLFVCLFFTILMHHFSLRNDLHQDALGQNCDVVN